MRRSGNREIFAEREPELPKVLQHPLPLFLAVHDHLSLPDRNVIQEAHPPENNQRTTAATRGPAGCLFADVASAIIRQSIKATWRIAAACVSVFISTRCQPSSRIVL